MTAISADKSPTSPVDIEAFIDPDRPESWSRQMVSLIESGHYREGYEILARKMPFVESQLRPYAEHLAGERNYWTGTFARIVEQIDVSRPLRVLDVGCGVGPIATEFGRMGHEGWGLDILPRMIERGRELIASLKLTGKVTLVEGDIRQPDHHFDEGFFDVAVACDIFEHLDDPSLIQVLRGLRKVVRPGGQIVIQTSPGRYYYWFDPARLKVLAMLVPMAWLPDDLFTRYVRWLDRAIIRGVLRQPARFYRHEYGHINCMDTVHLGKLMKQAALARVSTFAENAHRGFKDEGCLRARWTERLFGGKSVACRNVFGVAFVPDKHA